MKKIYSLESLDTKITSQVRVTGEETLFLFEHAPLEWLQKRASAIKARLHQNDVFYNRNIHFEPTNKCVYACKFCSFYRNPNAGISEGAWEYNEADLKMLLDKHPKDTITEIHITGGVHRDRGVKYAERLLSSIRKWRPELHIKAFTAVELDFFARKDHVSIQETLERLKKAGLNSLPGGGAEIFNPEIRKKIAGGKGPSYKWLSIHKAAHNQGLSSNATMLYGHIESFAHRVDHMEQLRTLQDSTCGFQAFIPLKYRNQNNALGNLAEISEEEDLRNFCISRIFFDNIPHLKAYWVMLGIKTAVKALDYGVDDLDGTVDDTTKIYTMAGGMESPVMTSAQLKVLIQSAGKIPRERNSLYQPY